MIYSLRDRHHQRVFISYRKADALEAARAVKRRLEQEQSPLPVFLDESSLKPVEHFTDQLQAALDQAAIVIVLISPYWNTEEGRRRIHDPDDIVRREIVFATRMKKVLLPVLLNGVRMPDAAILPEDVRHVALMQALPMPAVTGETLHQLVKEHSPVRKGGPIYTGLPLPPLLFTRSHSTQGVHDIPIETWYGSWECRTKQAGKSLTLHFQLDPNHRKRFTGIYAESRWFWSAKKRPMQGEWGVVVDEDSKATLGLFLKFTVGHEALQAMLPFHQMVGDAFVGADPSGNHYVTRNLRPARQGF